MKVRDNRERSRYEAETEAGLATVGYRRNGSSITFTHTEVPPALRGRGVGDALARAALEAARAERLSVVPQCPFIRAWIRRHPEFETLVAT